jgi:AraC-like DNA-binding protein
MASDWARYWCSPDQPLEAMHAHFERHVYHRHSHETYSFGVTETGAQAFACRGGAHVSAAGMVMAFNPDEPHDGHAASPAGFTYRMVHIGPDLVTELLGERAEDDTVPGRDGLPLFSRPVLADSALADLVRRLHETLTGTATTLARDEALAAAVAGLVSRAEGRVAEPAPVTGPDAARIARMVRGVLDERYAQNPSMADLAGPTGRSRFAAYRAFRAVYGLAPSDYQRQLRVREARQLIGQGVPIAEAADKAGFADQSHLNRWFTRYVGITPATYGRAVSRGSRAAACRSPGAGVPGRDARPRDPMPYLC